MSRDIFDETKDKINADPGLKALFEKAVAARCEEEVCGRPAPTDKEVVRSLEIITRLEQDVAKSAIVADICIAQHKNPSRPFEQVARTQLNRQIAKYRKP